MPAPPPAPSSTSIVPSSSVTNRLRRAYAKSRQDFEATGKEISNYVHQNTKKERTRMEEALRSLESKQQQLMQSAAMQRRKKEHQDAMHKLEDMTLQIQDMQRRAMRQIQGLDVSLDEKRQLWSQVQDGVQTIMHSDDELKAIEEFKRQFQAMLGSGDPRAPPLLL